MRRNGKNVQVTRLLRMQEVGRGRSSPAAQSVQLHLAQLFPLARRQGVQGNQVAHGDKGATVGSHVAEREEPLTNTHGRRSAGGRSDTCSSMDRDPRPEQEGAERALPLATRDQQPLHADPLTRDHLMLTLDAA